MTPSQHPLVIPTRPHHPNTQSGLSLQTPLRLAQVRPPPKTQTACTLPLSPPAAVYLIHDPTIIRESPVSPFLAQRDTHDDNELYFQRNISKWSQCEVHPLPIYHRDIWSD